MAEPWTITQLGGMQKEMILADASAPHGRPRQKPVVRDPIVLRESKTYYPGNDVPTRHVFGTKLEPFELEGRFDDSTGGRGYASKMTEYAKQFVADGQRVLVRWGNTVQVIGIIEKFDPGRESPAHVQWKMTIDIDLDQFRDDKNNDVQPPMRTPLDMSNAIENAINAAAGGDREQASVGSFPPSLDIGLGEFLDSLVSLVNTPFAAFSQMCADIENLEDATFGAINRLRAGLNQVRTAVAGLQDAYAEMQVEAAVVSAKASEQQAFERQRTDSTVSLLNALAEIDAADRELARAQYGRLKGLYTANSSDTWESIATSQLGNVARVNDIRTTNAVASGNPVPGTTYAIPV